ncbi:hypothetical protein [Streptomyces sp. NPDC017230]|uniref:hypothetical protein n=1 Tax=unclassified Streptomyces TaxID=2593676 RepID=UPI0037A3E63A
MTASTAPTNPDEALAQRLVDSGHLHIRSPAEQRAYLNIGDEDASVGLPGVRVCRRRPTNY